MEGNRHNQYIGISIKYRGALIALCSVTYVLTASQTGDVPGIRLYVIVGMLASSFLAIALYRRILKQQESAKWLTAIFFLELLAYGIFTLLSGGFSSPYFWYHIGCLLLFITMHYRLHFMIFGLAWCLGCAAAGHFFTPQQTINMEVNLVLGCVIMAATFYLLSIYLHRAIEHQARYRELNLYLKKEKEYSDLALAYSTDLYDSLGLLAGSSPQIVVEELAKTLAKAIAPSGCLLVKFDSYGVVEAQAICGIEAASGKLLIDEAITRWRDQEAVQPTLVWLELPETAEHGVFESVRIGKSDLFQGLLIRRKNEYQETLLSQDAVYCGLAEAIFRNLDIQRQLEEYIIADEQQRLAGEIHDTVIQKIFAMACNLKLLEQSVSHMAPAEIADHLETLKISAERVMQELREAIYGVRNEMSFQAKLALYMEDIETLTDTVIRLDLDENIDTITSAQKVAAYRIACEAVNNAVWHAKAQHVTILMQLDASRFSITIIDDGMSRACVKQHTQTRGNGLRNMKRMVFILGGDLTLDIGNDQGATLRAVLPRQ